MNDSIARASDLRDDGMARPGRRETDRPELIALVLVVAVVDVAALLAVTASMPIQPAIAFPGIADPRLAVVVGMAYWTAIALLGSLRAISLRGHGVLTFHMPFIVAAIALGGPVAGGWVALLGTFERRERTLLWYRVIYNHVVLSIAAVIAGLVLVATQDVLAVVGYDPQVTLLLGLTAATIVFALISTGLVVAAVTMRDDLELSEAVEIQVRSYRDTAAAEAIMGWLLAWVYLTIAPWAPIVVFIALLTIWRKTRDADIADWDQQTGVASRAHVIRRLETVRRGVAKGNLACGVLYIDMNGLKWLNDHHGHAYGDLLIEAVGARLARSLRVIDAPGRLGGDEFIVVLRDIADERTLLAIAWRMHDILVEQIPTMTWYEPGAAIGALLVDRDFAGNDASILIATADQAMYVAKRNDLGVHLATAMDLGVAIEKRREAERQRRDAEDGTSGLLATAAF